MWLGPVPLILTVKPEYIQEILNHGLEKAWIMTQAGYQLSGDSIMSSKGIYYLISISIEII